MESRAHGLFWLIAASVRLFACTEPSVCALCVCVTACGALNVCMCDVDSAIYALMAYTYTLSEC